MLLTKLTQDRAHRPPVYRLQTGNQRGGLEITKMIRKQIKTFLQKIRNFKNTITYIIQNSF